MRAELGSLVVSEEKLKEANTRIKGRVVILGLIAVVVMAVSTYL